MMSIEKAKMAKLRWRCHRGMLELDLILISFFDNKFTQLDSQLQQAFESLLTMDDPELYAILLGFEQVKIKELESIVRCIRDASTA